MALRRVLLDNEAWFITAGILGMSIKVHDKERGLTRRATRYERLYLLEVFEHMQHSGIRIGSGSPEVGEVFEQFAEAIFLRGRPTWEALFLVSSRAPDMGGAISRNLSEELGRFFPG
jgi:hypothetical protein